MKQSLPPITDRLSALSEPVRLRVCRVLEHHELTVGELAKVLQLPQSTVSRHLKMLSEAGWTQKRAEGTAALYRLVLDDLPPEARQLWVLVRGQMGDEAHVADDDRRVRAVLAERAPNTQAFFGRLGGDWDRVRKELFGNECTGRALAALLPRTWTIADFGSGTGNTADILGPFVREVILIDQSATMLDAARHRLSARTNVRFLEAPVDRVPLADGSVDAATCLLVLHHLANPAGAVREMARVVKPSGVVLVLDMVAHDRADYRHTMGHAHLGFTSDATSDLLTHAGLRVRTIQTLPSYPDARGPDLFVAVAEKSPPG
jgi:ArsR family transcriptional regulator